MSRLSRLGTRAAWACTRDQILEEATHFFVLLLKKLEALAEFVELAVFIFKSPLKLCMSAVLLMIALRQAPCLIPQSLIVLVALLKSGPQSPDLLLLLGDLLIVQKYNQRIVKATAGACKVGMVGRKILSHSLFTDSDILVCVGRFGFSEFLHTCHVSPSQVQSRLFDLSQKILENYWKLKVWWNKQGPRPSQNPEAPFSSGCSSFSRVRRSYVAGPRGVQWKSHEKPCWQRCKPKTKIFFNTPYDLEKNMTLLRFEGHCLPLTSYRDIEGISVNLPGKYFHMNTGPFPSENSFSKNTAFFCSKFLICRTVLLTGRELVGFVSDRFELCSLRAYDKIILAASGALDGCHAWNEREDTNQSSKRSTNLGLECICPCSPVVQYRTTWETVAWKYQKQLLESRMLTADRNQSRE